jgi:hypothetical protein
MMFERFFLWAMHRAARILFLISLLVLLIGLGPNVWAILSEASRLARDLGSSPGSPSIMVLNAAMTTLSAAAFPLFGAALIHLAERFLAAKRGGGSTHA